MYINKKKTYWLQTLIHILFRNIAINILYSSDFKAYVQ